MTEQLRVALLPSDAFSKNPAAVANAKIGTENVRSLP